MLYDFLNRLLDGFMTDMIWIWYTWRKNLNLETKLDPVMRQKCLASPTQKKTPNSAGVSGLTHWTISDTRANKMGWTPSHSSNQRPVPKKNGWLISNRTCAQISFAVLCRIKLVENSKPATRLQAPPKNDCLPDYHGDVHPVLLGPPGLLGKTFPSFWVHHGAPTTRAPTQPIPPGHRCAVCSRRCFPPSPSSAVHQWLSPHRCLPGGDGDDMGWPGSPWKQRVSNGPRDQKLDQLKWKLDGTWNNSRMFGFVKRFVKRKP